MANYVTFTSDKSRRMALFLCTFGGFLGLHRFYVGKFWTGVLYAFSFGLVGIGWFSDWWKLKRRTFTDNVGVPLRK